MGKQDGGRTATERGIAPVDDLAIRRVFDLRAVSMGRAPRVGDKLREVALLIRFDREGNAVATIGEVAERDAVTLLAKIDRNRSESGASPQVAFANLVQAIETQLRQEKERHERDAMKIADVLDAR